MRNFYGNRRDFSCIRHRFYGNRSILTVMAEKYGGSREKGKAGDKRMDVRIKVLKTEFYEDIADEYLSEGRAVGPCPILKEGDTFLYKSGEEAVMPEGFCPWAWVDLYAAISRRAIDRAPREAGKEYWYKHENKTIECCTDGVRPVIFLLEAVPEEE